MGIEYIIENLDKNEFLDFGRLGFGTKIGAMTSEPIVSFLSWLLVNPEGYGDNPPQMLGRWAGNRIEIIGDEGAGWNRQDKARKEFKDITTEVIAGFSEGSPFERITLLQPMGLIDKDGKVVVDPQQRESVAKYWKEVEEKENKETDRYLTEWTKLENTLRNGTTDQVRVLRYPVSGGPMQIVYLETGTEPPYLRIRSTTSNFMQHIPKLLRKPSWVDVLGVDFATEPGNTD
jgi:hypothetical protein